MKKKVVASMMVAAMVMGLTACGGGPSDAGSNNANSDVDADAIAEKDVVEFDGIQYNKSTDLTTENITLNYYTFDNETMCNILARRFEELYPNIKVNVTPGGDDYQATLTSLLQGAEQDVPDVVMYTDAEYALSNQILLDITDYYNNDPETKEMASTINDAGIGEFGTGRRFAVPVKYYPGIMYVDRNVVKALNLEMPSNNWTWDQMIQLIKDATQDDPNGGMKYYGLGYYNRLDSYYGIASSQDIVGEFGFNGKTFDLSAWAEGEQQFADLKQSGVVAPSQNSQEMEDWAGNWEAWCGTTGRVAVFSEAFWTFQSFWNTAEYQQYNLDIVPYVIPAVSTEDASKEHHSIANIDFGGVCSATKHPREAYELLKFMSFGRDGWLTRIKAYNDGELDADGVTPLKYSMTAPITTNEEVWDAYTDMFCDGMDDEHVELWKNYFASCMQPIPFGWTNIAGYWNYCDGYFNNIGIHDLVDSGKKKAADYAVQGTEQANSYHARAMIEYFGPDGYDILSDEDIAEYEAMIVEPTTTEATN